MTCTEWNTDVWCQFSSTAEESRVTPLSFSVVKKQLQKRLRVGGGEVYWAFVAITVREMILTESLFNVNIHGFYNVVTARESSIDLYFVNLFSGITSTSFCLVLTYLEDTSRSFSLMLREPWVTTRLSLILALVRGWCLPASVWCLGVCRSIFSWFSIVGMTPTSVCLILTCLCDYPYKFPSVNTALGWRLQASLWCYQLGDDPYKLVSALNAQEWPLQESVRC